MKKWDVPSLQDESVDDQGELTAKDRYSDDRR